jgi:hypothetical protein
MSSNFEERARKTKLRYGVLAILLAACGGITATPTVGGESHFLRECDDGCGSGLECVSGLCTRSCLVDRDSCRDLAEAAQCTDQSIEPGAVAVCDVACRSDADCVKLGGDFECESGFCRTDPPPVASGGSGGSANGTAGTGNAGGSMSEVPPWKPPALCALPFDAGPCLAAMPVWAAVDGQCVARTYGGCSGNENRFKTFEECVATCQGAPAANDCPEGYEQRETACLECGPAGGCAKLGTYCLQRCDAATACQGVGLTCFEGVCQAYGCI